MAKESQSFLEAPLISDRISIGAPVAIDHEAVKDDRPGLMEDSFAFSEDLFVTGTVGTAGHETPDIGFEIGIILPEFGSDTADTCLEGPEIAPVLHPGKAVLGIAEASCAEGDSPDKQSQSHV